MMAAVYRRILDKLVARGWTAPRRESAAVEAAIPLGGPALRPLLMARARSISSGAGLAGLSAAVASPGRAAKSSCTSCAPRRRPLPLLFRAGARPHHRQRQSSPALRQSRRARLSEDDRRRGHARRARRGRVRLRRSGLRRALAAASQRRAAALVDFLRAAARAGHARAGLSRASALLLPAARRDHRRGHGLQRAAL